MLDSNHLSLDDIQKACVSMIFFWLANIEIGTFCLAIVRCPAFFETFPVILIDEGGTVRADIGFRRASSLNSIEQRDDQFNLYWSGGILSSLLYSTPSVLKDYARKAQLGSIFTFDFSYLGFFCVFSEHLHEVGIQIFTALGKLFFFGHLWHASRGFNQSLWTGLTIPSLHEVQYGEYEKLGDLTTKTSRFI